MEDRIYITIARVLHGEASETDRKELEAWLEADENNAGIFEEMKASWADADALFDAPRFDAAPAWQKVSAAIHPVPAAELPKPGKTITFPSWIKYSSALAAVLVIAFFIWNPFSADTVRIVAETENKIIELPDHSVITLRKGSSLSYPKTFAGAERKVALAGEAFFEVARNEQQPFVIDAQAVQVKVLGTTFNVQCSKQSADVTVASGSVQVAVKNDTKKTVTLTAGHTAHYHDDILSESPANGSETFWRSGELSFKDEPFARVVGTIAAATDATIELDAGLSPMHQHQEITVSFRNQSLEDMLTELCLITNCRWEKMGISYIIRSK